MYVAGTHVIMVLKSGNFIFMDTVICTESKFFRVKIIIFCFIFKFLSTVNAGVEGVQWWLRRKFTECEKIENELEKEIIIKKLIIIFKYIGFGLLK